MRFVAEVPTDHPGFGTLAYGLNTRNRLLWNPSQVAGEANTSQIYVTISECPGDFRIPPTNQAAPANDRTFARGCRNVRPLPPNSVVGPTSNINMLGSTEPSTDQTCHLEPGRTYYLSYVRADASDGVIGGSTDNAGCNAVVEDCGIDLQCDPPY